MKNEELKKASGYIKTHRLQKRWQKVVTCLAAVVVFCTTYALILPAITLEKEPCQLPEHTHTEACYTQVSSGTEAVHTHSEDCYTWERGALICTEEEGLAHQHTAPCYGTWELTCGLEEHTHTAECNLPVELTEEEQAQVEEVIALIDALPTQAEMDETLAALEEAGDEDGCDAYLTEIVAQAKAAYEAYSGLTEAQQEQVTNAEKLLALEPLWSAQTLVSKPLTEDKAYIGTLAMGTSSEDTSGGITDGSAPWDSTDDDGLDTSASNRRVRTFDTVTYDFYYTTALQDPQSTTSYDSARVCFEFLLPAAKSQALFSVDEMTWLKADGVSYVYEEELVEVNGNSYQVLHGSFLDEREGSEITAAARSRDVVIRVLNMANGSTIQPVFTMWLQVNDVGVTYQDNIPKGTVYGSTYFCKQHGMNTAHTGHEWKTVIPDEVTVTCTPRYAVTLKRGEVSATSRKGDSDFSTGNNLEGLTWLDDNGDGIQDVEESRISGVKVELLKLKDGGDAANESDYEPYCYPNTNTPIAIETGQQISVLASDSSGATTYEQGRYKFTDLPAGIFAVRFTDGDTTKISPLIASPSNRGSDDTKDSDGIATYTINHATLEKTVILGIDMPTAENMSVTPYESKYHDSGFYEKSHELPNTGGPGTTPYTTGGLLLLTGAGVLLLYSNKKRRKEDFASS